MKIIGLKLQSEGTNKVFNGCCPSRLTFYVELEPGEPTHNVHRVLWTDGGGCGSTIVTVGSNPYSNPLSTNFVLTAGIQMEVTVDFCPCQGIGVIDTYTLTIETQSPTSTHTFLIDFEGVDINDYKLVDETESYFFDCLNPCGTPKDVIHFNNPTALPIEINYSVNPVCGFRILTKTGTGIFGTVFTDITSVTTFKLLPNQTTTIVFVNDNCAVTTECDFDFNYDICSLVADTVNVKHRIVDCGSCGIDCHGIQFATSTGSYASIIADNNFANGGDWTINNTYIGNSNSVGLGYLQLIENTAGYNEWRVTPNPPVNWPTGSYQVNYELEIRTGLIDNTNNQLTFYSGAGANPFTVINNISSNQTYIVQFTDIGFVAPGIIPGNAGFLQLLFMGALTGNNNFINYYDLRISFAPIGTVDVDCSSFDPYNYTAIGDLKTGTFDLFYEKGFQNLTEVYFNPWLFSSTGNFGTLYPAGYPNTRPAGGWFYQVDTSQIGNGFQPMTLINPFGNNPNSWKNIDVQIELIDFYSFRIQFSFYMIEDLDNWITALDIANQPKLLKNQINSPVLDNTNFSVYNNQKMLAVLFYVYDPNIIIGYNQQNQPVYYECYLQKRVFFEGRFWNKGLRNNPSEMTNPTWTLMRAAVPVNDISIFDNTEITFEIDYINPVDTVVFWLFDANNFNNTVDFVQNYDSSRIAITTNPGSVQLDNNIWAPSQAPTNIGGNTYQVKAVINTLLNNGGDYYIGAICYSSTDGMVNSFLKKLDLKVTPDPWTFCCPMDVETHWLDYNNDYTTNCFSPALKERIRNRMFINGGDFQDCIDNFGAPLAWNNYLNFISLRIYRKIDNYPIPGKVTYFQFAEYISFRQVGFPNNWNNPNSNLYVAESGSSLYVEWGGRVLFNDSLIPGGNVYTADMSTPTVRTNVGALGNTYVSTNNILYNWADQDIYFEYQFNFDLTPIVGVSSIVNLYQINVCHPSNYETNPTPFGSILDPLEVWGVNQAGQTLIANQFCSGSYDYLLVRVSGAAVTGQLIATLNYYPYTEANLKENESFTSPNGAAQLTDVIMYDVSSSFVGNEAFFKIDVGQLPPGKYQICGIRIP